MKTKPSITSLVELTSLPNFVENNTITPDNFSAVIAEYEIRERDMYCCLTDDKGRCGRPHYRGYLIELKDTTLSIMGNDCAERKFGAQGNIFDGINLFKKVKGIKEKLGRIYDFSNDYDSYHNRINILEKYIKDIEYFYSNFLLIFGHNTPQYLEKRYKVNKPNIEVKTFKYNDDDNPEYIATHTIGNIPSLNLFDKRDIKNHVIKINRLKTALRDAVILATRLYDGETISNSELHRRSRAILIQLNTFDDFEKNINQTIDDITRFKNTDLTPLCFLSNDEYSSKSIAKYVMLQKGINGKTPETFIRQLEIQYATQYKCHFIEATEHAFYWQ